MAWLLPWPPCLQPLRALGSFFRRPSPVPAGPPSAHLDPLIGPPLPLPPEHCHPHSSLTGASVPLHVLFPPWMLVPVFAQPSCSSLQAVAKPPAQGVFLSGGPQRPVTWRRPRGSPCLCIASGGTPPRSAADAQCGMCKPGLESWLAGGWAGAAWPGHHLRGRGGSLPGAGHLQPVPWSSPVEMPCPQLFV